MCADNDSIVIVKSTKSAEKQEKGVTSSLTSPLIYNAGQCPSLGRFVDLDDDVFMTSNFARG